MLHDWNLYQHSPRKGPKCRYIYTSTMLRIWVTGPQDGRNGRVPLGVRGGLGRRWREQLLKQPFFDSESRGRWLNLEDMGILDIKHLVPWCFLNLFDWFQSLENMALYMVQYLCLRILELPLISGKYRGGVPKYEDTRRYQRYCFSQLWLIGDGVILYYTLHELGNPVVSGEICIKHPSQIVYL